MNKLTRFAIPIAIGLIIWFLPVPEGVKPEAWRLFAIMAATIIGCITNPLPIGAVAFISLSIVLITKTLPASAALSGFSSGTIWMILAAFMFCRAFIKTGLGTRIALAVLSKIGDSTLKISYGLAFTGLLVAPATPSGTARGGGIIYPILRSICSVMKSEPDKDPEKSGRFLIQTYYQTEPILSAMFLTAMAANPLAVSLAKDLLHIEISWGTWFIGALVPGLISLIVIPAAMYFFIEPPTVKKAPEAKKMAHDELKKLGVMSFEEKMLLIIFIASLVFWCSDAFFLKLGAHTIAMVAVGFMLILNVLTWNDVLSEKGGWDTFVWMGVLVCLAGQLSKLGFISWFAAGVSQSLAGLPWMGVLAILVIVFMYSQYGFASLTAHVAGLYSAFLAVAVSAGTPPLGAALLLAYTGCICYSLTQYSSGPAPIFFGAGYYSVKDWWKVGFKASVVHLLIWGTVGPLWFYVLGFWN
ncbi:MAG: anion permease [Campylobacteraceae bacterium]